MAVADHIADIVDVADLLENMATGWTGTYAGIVSSQLGAPDGDVDGELTRYALYEKGLRAEYARMLYSVGVNAFSPVLRSLAKTLDRNDITPDSDPEVILGIGLREYMLANSKVFKSRGVTNSAASAVTGTGTGTLLMRATDSQGTPDALEAVTDGTITFTCIRDKGAGTDAGEEEFEVKDERPAIDVLEVGGSPVRDNIKAVHAGSTGLLTNSDLGAAFSSSESAAKIPGWTITGTTTNLTADSTNKLRSLNTVKFSGDAVITQSIVGLLNADGPVALTILYNREAGTGTGTLKLRLGAKESTVSVASGTGWQRLTVMAWPSEFSGGGFDIDIEINGSSTGYTVVGQVVLQPMIRIGGRYFIIVAGATDFEMEDYFTQDTAVADSGIIKKWLHRIFGRAFELPHDATASSGYEDPS